MVKNYHLLTKKSIIYVANVGEDDLADIDNCELYNVVKDYASKEGNEVIPVSCEIESQLSELPKEDRALFLADLGIWTCTILAVGRIATLSL